MSILFNVYLANREVLHDEVPVGVLGSVLLDSPVCFQALLDEVF